MMGIYIVICTQYLYIDEFIHTSSLPDMDTPSQGTAEFDDREESYEYGTYKKI